ncbi:MAG: Ig-like domain-containing protein [Gemmatimonadota bacterium]|nr:Ig-like domain-containing protein [Gemmatimonadota bacterium]
MAISSVAKWTIWITGILFVAFIAAALPSLLAGDREWKHPHEPLASMDWERPECPATWTGLKVPIVTAADSLRSYVTPASLTHGGAYTVPAAGFALTGPITDVPEFHDCQRFLTEDRSAFSPLFAVFASKDLGAMFVASAADSISWASSDATVATVTAQGVVTAVAVGNAVITGTWQSNPQKMVKKTFAVVAAAAPEDAMLSLSPGPVAVSSVGIQSRIYLTANFGHPTATTPATAMVYSYGVGYQPLGIGLNFSCLYAYVTSDGRFAARMVSLGTNDANIATCDDSYDPTSNAGTELKLVRTANASTDPLPGVARWDYDAVNKRYYIGFTCGNAWCEAGSDGGASRFAPSARFSTNANTTADEARVLLGKGWYDQQDLARDVSAGDVVPSGLVATVIPHPLLKNPELEDYKNGWVRTGYVGITALASATDDAKSYYKAKFNYDIVPVGPELERLNKISICFGRKWTCVGLFQKVSGIGCGSVATRIFTKYAWAKYEAANGGEAIYRCVVRRDHSPPTGTSPYIVPTARWRWLARDETVWEYCASSGCCETMGDL